MNMGELCPRFEKAMQLLSTRWVGLILSELLKGKKRFSEMESDLPISGRLLSDRLKMLEKEQIVERKVFSEFPVRIEYSIRTGNSENTFLSTICSFSSIFNRSDSNRPLMGKSLSISEKRFFPFNSSDKMSPTQRVLNNCIAFSNRGHNSPMFITSLQSISLT